MLWPSSVLLPIPLAAVLSALAIWPAALCLFVFNETVEESITAEAPQ